MNNIYKLVTLKNNLKVLFYPRTELHSVTLNCRIKVGSANDPKGKNGLAHLLEHLLLEKTAKLDQEQFAQAQEGLAGDFFALTDQFVTIVEGTFHYSKIIDSLNLLKDIIFERSFSNSQISDAKIIIEEEIKQGEDDLMLVVSKYAKKIRFKKDPAVSFQGYGDKITLEKIKLNDIMSFYQEHFLPENIILGITGNFELDSTIKKIKEIFENIETFSSNKVKTIIPVIEYSEKTVSLVPKPCSEIYAMITFPALSKKDAHSDRLTMNLISFLLTGINSSKLFRLLRLKEKLVYDVSAETVIENNYGVFGVSWASNPTNFPRIVKKIITVLEDFKNGNIKDSEIQRFRNILNKGNEMDFDNPSDALGWLLDDLGYEKKIVLPEEIVKMRNKITAAKIQEISRKIFDFNKINIVAVGPVKNLDLELK